MNNEETKILDVSVEGIVDGGSQSIRMLQNGKYRIERILGQGGFGITYLATDVMLNRKVAIKEFFLKEFCIRDTTASVFVSNPTNSEFVERYLLKFLKEAQTLANLRHKNIIQVYESFKENNTAYYVMEYVKGETLQDIVNRKGKLNEQEALGYMNQVAEALEYIHSRRINHLDVKPANIMVSKTDVRTVLIDFGVAKQYDTIGNQTSTTPVGISHGYAPLEQYNPGGVSTFSPQTDIYSFGVTLYKLVTGNTPPAATEILNDGVPPISMSISYNTREAIKKAMSVRKCDRFEKIADVLPKNNINSGEPKTSFQSKTMNNPRHVESDLKKRADEIKKEIVDSTTKLWSWTWLSLTFGLFILGCICGQNSLGSILIILTFIAALGGGLFVLFGTRYRIKKKCIEWKEMHPNDPVCKYIKTDSFWNIEFN